MPLPVTGTVAVTGVSKMPLPVTGTVEVTGGEEGFRLTNDLFVVGPTIVSDDVLFPLSGPVTAVSLHSDRRAFLQFRKDSNLVHTIFLEPGDSVNLTFPHPLDADSVTVACNSGTCTIRLAISGYVESP